METFKDNLPKEVLAQCGISLNQQSSSPDKLSGRQGCSFAGGLTSEEKTEVQMLTAMVNNASCGDTEQTK